ncbi:MAG: tetratricopeptide repeat protein [Bacteroidota bacterium]
MIRIILYIGCCILAEGVFAQQDKQHRVPEFAKMPSESRFDSMNQWYVNNVYLPEVNKSKAERSRLMDEARDYADRSNDIATQVSMTYFKGHFISAFERDSTKGMHYMIAAVDLAEKNGLEYEWAFYTFGIGLFNMTNDQAKSLEYFTRAIEVMDRISPYDKTEVLSAKYVLGTLYFHLRNYGTCIQTIIPVLKGWDNRATKIEMIQATNTIGLAYREIGKSDSALFYFWEVLRLAESKPTDPSWIGIASGNIGSIYLKQGQLDSALIYARRSYKYVKENPSVSGVTVAEVLVLLSSIYIEQHKSDLVIPMLMQADTLIRAKQIYHSYNAQHLMFKVCYLMAKALYEKGNYRVANKYLQKTLELQKEISNLDNAEIYTTVQKQLEAAKHISKMKDAEHAITLSEQRNNFSIAGLCLIGLILFNLYRRERIRTRKNKELFESKEQLLLVEKKQAEQNLLSYIETLQEKNKLIEHVEKEIMLLKMENDSPEKHAMIETLTKLKRSTIITSDDWIQFKFLFEKTHTDFFGKLKERFPDITQAEMRMMALMKLDIPTRKMADMLGISPESTRKTQYRFIKKMNLTGMPDLTGIVNSL